MSDLGTLGGSSVASGINNSGQVVGYSYTSGSGVYHAFLYSGGVMSDLGTLGGGVSLASGINNSGQVVGDSQTTGNEAFHAFLYSGGIMSDLNNLFPNNIGTYLYAAIGINDSGQIIADGENGHAYLLTETLLPQFLTTSVSGGVFHFSWNTVNAYPSVGYQMQYTTNLANTNWSNLGGVLTGTNATLSATDTNSPNPQRFYRLLLVQ
jgi:probable HAF family extracellular repeat protein